LEKKGKNKLLIFKLLNPKILNKFTSFDTVKIITRNINNNKKLKYKKGKKGNLEEKIILKVNIKSNIKKIIKKVIKNVKNIIFV